MGGDKDSSFFSGSLSEGALDAVTSRRAHDLRDGVALPSATKAVDDCVPGESWSHAQIFWDGVVKLPATGAVDDGVLRESWSHEVGRARWQ